MRGIYVIFLIGLGFMAINICLLPLNNLVVIYYQFSLNKNLKVEFSSFFP